MGIRFEYGARKATNGPVIFFSDPLSEVNLKEEIRGAIESRLSFYAYRMPGDMMVSFGSSEGTVEGIGQPGFVIAPFLPGQHILTIPYAPAKRENRNEAFPFPASSTTKEEYLKEIAEIQKEIEHRSDQKIVAARTCVVNEPIDAAVTFINLVRAYPDAYVYCFSTPETGCWIGATPELLLRRNQEGIFTMALAGTRLAGTPGEWDNKNRQEQEMVADYVVKAITDSGLIAEKQPTYTREAGNVEHLCTPIFAKVNPGDGFDLTDLLHRLSPTPATAGEPREKALKVIEECETFPRAYYGGFCGPMRNDKDLNLYVILRCARVEKDRYALFAGGGITAASDPDAEWDETELKLSTLKTHISKED